MSAGALARRCFKITPMVRRIGPLLIGAFALGFAPPASGDALVENLNPRSIGMGETMRGSAHAGLSTSLNPAGLALSQQLVFEGTFGYRPEDGGIGASASACDATVAIAGCFYYQYFRASPEIEGEEERRRVHETGSLFASQLGEMAYAGVNVKYFDYRSELPGEEEGSGFGLDAGVALTAGDHVDLGLAGYNLIAHDAAQYPRGIGSGVTITPMEHLALALDGVWNLDEEDGTGRYGLGGEYFFRAADAQAGVPVRLGGIYDVGREGGYVTGGVGYMTRRAGVDAGARYQVSGGDELMMLVSVRLFGPTSPGMR